MCILGGSSRAVGESTMSEPWPCVSDTVCQSHYFPKWRWLCNWWPGECFLLMMKGLNYFSVQTITFTCSASTPSLPPSLSQWAPLEWTLMRFSSPLMALCLSTYESIHPISSGHGHTIRAGHSLPGAQTTERALPRELMSQRTRCQLNCHSELKY